MVRLHQPSSENDLDLARWMRIKDLRNEIAKDTGRKPSIISQIKEAFLLKDFQKASDLQIKLYA